MLEEAYGGVTMQCAAQIALANSEARVTHLIDMAYTSDEGCRSLSQPQG